MTNGVDTRWLPQGPVRRSRRQQDLPYGSIIQKHRPDGNLFHRAKVGRQTTMFNADIFETGAGEIAFYLSTRDASIALPRRHAAHNRPR